MAFAPLQSAHLLYRRLGKEDAEALSRLGSEWEVVKYTSRMPHPLHATTATYWIETAGDALAAGTVFTFGVFTKQSQQLIGTASVAMSPAYDEAELGYWLGVDLWGQGLGTEIAHRLVSFALADLQVSSVWGGVHPDNAASIRVLEKAGLRQTGQAPMMFSAQGGFHDALIYRLDRTKWAHDPKLRKTYGLPVVLVGAAALMDGDDCVLMAARPEGKSMAGLWEFPGGKVEPGESPAAAAAREFEEELGITIPVKALLPFDIASHHYETFHLLMPTFICRQWHGAPIAKEGQKFDWIPARDLGSLEVPPADIPLIETFLRRF